MVAWPSPVNRSMASRAMVRPADDPAADVVGRDGAGHQGDRVTVLDRAGSDDPAVQTEPVVETVPDVPQHVEVLRVAAPRVPGDPRLAVGSGHRRHPQQAMPGPPGQRAAGSGDMDHPKFGLIAIDRDRDFARTPKPSAHAFARIAATGRLGALRGRAVSAGTTADRSGSRRPASR
jgi:hypothetical protein